MAVLIQVCCGFCILCVRAPGPCVLVVLRWCVGNASRRPLSAHADQRRGMGVRPLMQLQADMLGYVQLVHREVPTECLAMTLAVGSSLPSSQHSAAPTRAAAAGKADRSTKFHCRGCGTLKGACPEWTKWNGLTCPICVSASRNQLKGIRLPVHRGGPHPEYEKHATRQRDRMIGFFNY